MANDNKEIGDIVKKCKILLLDIEGTTTSISFVKDNLFPYVEQNVKEFLNSQWENAAVKEVVTALRKLSIEDKESSVEGVVVIPGEDASKEEQIEGLVKNVKWQMSADRKVGPLKNLQGLIWTQGYDKGEIKGHVFDDVSAALEAWHSADDHKVYIFSSGSVQAQKLLFSQSTAGDLLKYIDGHFDTGVGPKQEAQSYTNIVEKLGCKPEEILFLTDIVKEAEAARSAGVHAALMSRAGNSPLPAAAAAAFPVLHSLAELTRSNKRKPDTQEETPAAKILKTDTVDDAKTTPETPSTETASAETTETEKMEVEEKETVSTCEENPALVKEHVIVEELESNDGSVASVIDVEPAAVELPGEEKGDKTEQKETKDTAKAAGDAGGDKPAPVDVMEVEEVTEEKIAEAAEVIEDVEPIIEEPDNNGDAEDLKNVGEVLEKECDEILSKVNNVTNLDNITIKPMLNPIDEENMETDNLDTNDIVDSILDNENDHQMKQPEDIDASTVTEMTDEAKTDVEENGVKKSSPTDKDIITENTTSVEEKKNEATKKDEVVPKKDDVVTEQKDKDTEKKDVVSENNIKKVAETSPVEANAQDLKIDDAQKPKAQNTETKVEVSSAVETTTESNENKTDEEKKSDVTEVVKEVTKAEEAPTKEETTVVKEDKQAESKTETEEPQLNGSAANGVAKVVPFNGDASKEEELSARLTDGAVSNGKVNGANGESAEQGQGDCKAAEVPDIKVKSVPSEPRTDPVDQPTEA